MYFYFLKLYRKMLIQLADLTTAPEEAISETDCNFSCETGVLVTV